MARTKQTAKDAESRADVAKKSKGLKAEKRVPQKQAKAPKKAAAKQEQAAKIVKKAHRWHPGTVALREIRDQQKNKSWQKPAIPLTAFERVVREVASKAIDERGLTNLQLAGAVRWQAGAIRDLYQCTEDYLCTLMHRSVRAMAHAKRKTLMMPDLMLTLGAYNEFDQGTIKHDLKGYDDPDAPLIERAVRIAKLRNSGKKAPRKVAPQRNKAAAKEQSAEEPAAEPAAVVAEEPPAEPEKPKDDSVVADAAVPPTEAFE